MNKKKAARSFVLIAVFAVMFLILTARVFYLQIIKGEEYAENFRLQIKREITLPGTRGNIYDKNGKLLAGNKIVYSATIEDQENYKTDRERHLDLNSRIYKAIRLIKEHGDSPENNLKITADENGGFRFTADGFELDRFKADVYGRRSVEDMTEEEKSSDAEQVIADLSDCFCIYAQDDKSYTDEEKAQYGLSDQFEQEEVLELVSVRYALSLQEYQKYLPVTVARDVSEETAAALLESEAELPGVDVSEESIRVYEGGEAFASILGYTGKISAAELEEKGEGYTAESIVGKAGLEQYLDDVLQGENGRQEVYIDNMGRTVQDLGVTEEPRAGRDVYLSIDMDLQQKAYETLERKIADILVENLINAKTFDKTAVNDTTEIRIPVYDVYTALLTNGLIDTSHFQEGGASETEREVYQRFSERRDQVLGEIQAVLNDPEAVYAGLDEEMQEYLGLITGSLGILDSGSLDKNTELYEKWASGDISVNEYLNGAIQEGGISSDLLSGENGYLRQEEIYSLVTEEIVVELQGNPEFEETIYKYMVLRDEITPDQVCMILYDQGVLDTQDGDFAEWQRGSISSYELVLRKIQRLEITPGDLALDPCSGSAVVTDADTGKVLACVSYPGYDNNRLANQMDDAYYYRIYNNAALPLYNRATQQLSAPGSTFKPVTIIAGLSEGVTGVSTPVMCDGVFDKVDPPLRCWNHSGHGNVAGAADALQHSCNDYLCEVSYRLGMKGQQTFSDGQALEYIQKYAEMFDLDKKSGIELTESSPQVTDSYAIPSAIGQGTNNFSTVQLGRYVTTLANRGTSFRLSLVEQIDGIRQEPEQESAVELPDEIWEAVHTGMEQYAQSTGIFEGFPIPAAGKSGTAQESRTRPDHGLFVGYAPADEPEIAVAVRIANGYEAGCAVECGREIFESYFNVGQQAEQADAAR